uniref:Retrovirus-related Pol polyprotein from transposon TNT 1-94 n=1 Tax=Tanacetum cinerariifolium TaxID=118510 RepID=A0A6L2LG69_TANCI|nr:hypothetical protein [Tanacetum cinerariifolium]
MCFNSSTGLHSCQLDEKWFNLHKDILRDPLDITPINDSNPYVAPPSSDTVIKYINTLGYPANTSCASDSLGKNLATASHKKKKTTYMLILNIRFVGKDGREIFDVEHGKAEEGGATESLKATKGTKPKAAKATKPAGDKASTITSTQTPKTKPAPTQPSKAVPEKKKLVKETLDEPSPIKRSKGGLVEKIRKPKSPLKLIDEPSVEDVPVEEPAYNEEEANLQWALELSLKEQTKRTQGPARPMVIREPDSKRIQPLPDVQGNRKENTIDEQAAHDLLTLLNPKNKSHVDQFIFQRRTLMLTKASGHTESPFLAAELPLTDSQAGPNPGIQDEGQAGLNPGDATESQPQSSHVVHAGPNRKHMKLEATNASTRKNHEQMDEEFTTTAYPNVQENLKLPYKDLVIPDEPASSTGTQSSLQNLEKELSFTYQFFIEKQQEKDP